MTPPAKGIWRPRVSSAGPSSFIGRRSLCAEWALPDQLAVGNAAVCRAGLVAGCLGLARLAEDDGVPVAGDDDEAARLDPKTRLAIVGAARFRPLGLGGLVAPPRRAAPTRQTAGPAALAACEFEFPGIFSA
jgi:hypothetical protein